MQAQLRGRFRSLDVSIERTFSQAAVVRERHTEAADHAVIWAARRVPRWAAICTGSSKNGAAASHARAACPGVRLLVKLIT